MERGGWVLNTAPEYGGHEGTRRRVLGGRKGLQKECGEGQNHSPFPNSAQDQLCMLFFLLAINEFCYQAPG